MHYDDEQVREHQISKGKPGTNIEGIMCGDLIMPTAGEKYCQNGLNVALQDLWIVQKAS